MFGSPRIAVWRTALIGFALMAAMCACAEEPGEATDEDENDAADDDANVADDDALDDDGDDDGDDTSEDDDDNVGDDDQTDDDSGDDDVQGSFARAATVAVDLDEAPDYGPTPIDTYNGASVSRILDPQPRVTDNALAIDDEGTVYIAVTTFGEARIYRRNQTGWQRETIGDKALLSYVEMDEDEKPMVIYSGEDNYESDDLRYSVGFPPSVPQTLFSPGPFDGFLPQARADRAGVVHVAFGETMRFWQRQLKIYYAKSVGNALQIEAVYTMQFPEPWGLLAAQAGPWLAIDADDRVVIGSCITTWDEYSSYGYYCGLWHPDDGSTETFGPFADPFPGPLVFEENDELISVPIITDYDQAFNYRRRSGNQWILDSCWPGTVCPDQEPGHGSIVADTEANDRVGVVTTIDTDILWYLSVGAAGNRSWRLQGPRVGFWAALEHDSEGRPHVAFTTGGRLRHGVLDEAADAWSFETVDQGTNIQFADGGFNVDGELDICIESNDEEVIYLSTENGDVAQELVHSRFHDVEPVQTDGCAAAREANGIPWVFFTYQNADWYHLMAGSRDAGSWSAVTLAQDDYAHPPKPIAITGRTGTVHAVWTPNENPGIYYVRSNGDGTLATELVDYSSEYRAHTIHESDDGNIYIAVRGLDLSQERFLLRRDGAGNWATIFTPESLQVSSIFVDDGGLIHLLADGSGRDDCQWLTGNGDGIWNAVVLEEDDCIGKLWKDDGGVVRAVYVRRNWNSSSSPGVLVEGYLDGSAWVSREVSGYGVDAKLLDARMADEDTIDAVFFMARQVNNTDPTLYRATLPLE